MLREEAEEAVRSLKAQKSSRVDNTPSVLLENGGEATTTVLTALWKKIWETEEIAKGVDTIALIPSPKKSNLKQCENCCTISLIRHHSKSKL